MVIGRVLPDAVAAGPLHHRLPGDHGGASRKFGHGSLARARAGGMLMKAAEKAPDSVLEAAGKLMSPGRRSAGPPRVRPFASAAGVDIVVGVRTEPRGVPV